MVTKKIRKELRRHSSKKNAKNLQRFFKTGPGEYGEGDIFLGVKVPEIRKIVKRRWQIDLKDIVKLLRSKFHEERLLALLILVKKYKEGNDASRKKIYAIYFKHKRYINNWDLIDLTANHIVGSFLADKDKGPIYKLAGSGLLWDRRISVLATFHFIKNKRFTDATKIAKILLNDPEDLIHKAVGWMLREIGKRDLACEERFLQKHYREMPRTMLRYAIERFPAYKRTAYLIGAI
ncbi:MAG: DNA alkylation repair protein [Candidatus Omnitrophota bacterium]